jgi:hypothetical protein
MLSSKYLFLPIIMQMLIVSFDEVYYHNKRPLKRSEQLGHALDTLTVLLPLALMLFIPPTTFTVLAYTILSIFSCLFITKDELGYHHCCEAGERWLHAMAFTLHPLAFIGAGLLWPAIHLSASTNRMAELIRYRGDEVYFIAGNAALLLLFGIYEVIPRDIIWAPVLRLMESEKIAFDV